MDGSEEPEVRGKASNLKHAVKEAQLAQFTRFQKYIRKKSIIFCGEVVVFKQGLEEMDGNGILF